MRRVLLATTVLFGLSGHALAADAVVEEPVLTVEERAKIFEMDIWGGYLWRGGNALNDGGTLVEDDEYPLIGGGALAGIPLGDSGLVQLELDGEATFQDHDQDTYEGSFTAGGHLAWWSETYLLGAFAAGGRTYVVDSPGTHYFAGLEGKTNFANASLALQGGYIGTDFNDDGPGNEFLTDAYFVRGIGQVFFNGGRTMLQGDLAYANGTQDKGDPIENDLDLYAWGLELEHAPDMDFAGGALSLFAAYEGVHVVENVPDDDDDKLTDHTVRVGLKLRFGATTPLDRERATAPDLPNVARWEGAVRAVD